MDTVLKFDRVILTKELNERIKKVGDVFEVANILDGSFLLREAKTKVAIGVISFEDFEKHFVKEEEFSGWTKWTPLTGFNGQTDALYRTNRRRVQVKFLTANVKATAFCNRKDDFNLFFGVQMAYMRCLNKAWSKQKASLEEALKIVNQEMTDNKRSIEDMINSLD